MKHLISNCLLVLCFLAASCQKELPHSEVEGDTNGPFTLILDSTTSTTASFTGSIDLRKYEGYEEVGIIYSLDEVLDSPIDTSNRIPITIIDQDCVFNKKIMYLLHDTMYYYTSYVRLSNGLYQLGNVKTFKTAPVSFLRPDISKTATTATFDGKLDLPYDDLNSLDFGVVVSADPELEENVMNYGISVSDDGEYSITIYNLTLGTEYYYSLYAKCGRHITYGSTESFTTNKVSFTAYSSNVSYSSAEIYGNISVYEEDRGQYIEYGILVSPYDNLSIESSSCRRIRVNDYMNVNGEYSVAVTGLEGTTTYYYCTYALQGDKCYYGPVGSFTTKGLSLSLYAPTATQTRVTFSGSYPNYLADADIYIQYAESEGSLLDEYSYNVRTLSVLKDASNNSFYIETGGLTFNTTYYYRYRIYADGTYQDGRIGTFNTQDVQVTLNAYQSGSGGIKFYGTTDLTESGCIEVGVEYYPSGYEYHYGVTTQYLTYDGGDFSYTVSGLNTGYDYIYRYYIAQNGKIQYGDYYSVSLR